MSSPDVANVETATNSATPQSQRASKPNQTASGCRIGYLKSANGVIRLLIILFQFAGFISVIFAVTSFSHWYYASAYSYIFFGIAGIVVSVAVLLLFLLGLNRRFDKIPWKVIVVILDALSVIPYFTLGIVCSQNEAYLGQYDRRWYDEWGYSRGAYAAASVFAFFCAFLYFLDILIYLYPAIRTGGKFSAILQND